MKVNVIATGSSGNCVVLQDESTQEKIMIDAGITLNQMQKATNYQMPDYLLITHEHCDHVIPHTLITLLKRGVEVYMTAGTKTALNIEARHNLHILKENVPIRIGNYEVTALKAVHYAAEPVCYGLEGCGEKILYATDTGEVPIWENPRPYTKILIERNYVEEKLLKADIDEKQRQRILQTHLSAEKVDKALENWREAGLVGDWTQITFLHASKRHI